MSEGLKKELSREVEIPTGIEAVITEKEIIMKKNSKETSRKIIPGIIASKKDNKIVLQIKKIKRSEKKNLGTIEGHVKNMIKGLEKEYEYILEICNVHFPMTVDFDKKRREILIKNMLGEKYPRTLKVDERVEVEIKVPKVFIRSHDKELAGQTAGELEKVSRVRNRDRNKFQDGIFITKKPEKEAK